MPRRPSATSIRQRRRPTNRRLPLNRNQSLGSSKTGENDAELAENEEITGFIETDVATGTDIIVLDEDSTETTGNRRRAEKANTPQRGMNKKKARFEAMDDSISEEEIIFEDCISLGSHKSTDTPPEPRRLCNSPPQGPRPPSSQSSTSSKGSGSLNSVASQPAPTNRTMASVVTENFCPMQPAAHNIRKSCRYTAQLLVPPDESPVKKAGSLLQETFKEIQRQAGTQIWLSAWCRDDTLLCKRPKDIPIGMNSDARDIYTRLFLNYMSIPPGSEKLLYLKIHFVTESPDALKISLKDIGLQVEGLNEKFGFRLGKNPIPCQAPKVSTIGWCFGSVKSMDSETLLKAVRVTLKIPDHVTLGAQWRTIADQHGKKYPWPQDSTEPRPPQALHIDIEDVYFGVWYPKFAKLWKKGATKRVNYLQVRLVPCFTTEVGKSLTPAQHSDTVLMHQKQAHLVNIHTMRLTNSNILDIDYPVGENKVTLRRYLMMKAPEGLITDRIVISVDKAYRGNEFVLTVPKIYADQAVRTLHNMIPECLHLYGDGAARWFTNVGLMAYQDAKWDPLLNVTTSANDEATAELVEENYFGMGDVWKTPTFDTRKATTVEIEELNRVPARTVAQLLEARAKIGIHDDVSSFGDAFGRSHSGSTVAPPRRNTAPTDMRPRRVGFHTGTESASDDNNPRTENLDDVTVSTMGTEITTGSTRRTLRHQVEINNALRTEGNQIAAERDKLQQMLEKLQAQLFLHGITPTQDTHSVASDTTPDLPAANRVPPSTEADSAGRKN